jgi:LEA14-like dessication related protein
MADVLSSFLPEILFDSVPCCGVASPFQGVQIHLQSARPKAITMSGFKVDVTLNIHNPNRTALCTTGFTYKVAQKGENGAVFAEGTMDEGITLPRGETTQVVVPVSCSYGGVGSLGKSLVMGGTIEFVMSGETQYKIPMTETTYTLPYQVEGSFAPKGETKQEHAED